jgi:hypothetical protein
MPGTNVVAATRITGVVVMCHTLAVTGGDTIGRFGRHVRTSAFLGTRAFGRSVTS